MKSVLLFSLLAILTLPQSSVNSLAVEFGNMQEKHVGQTLHVGYWTHQNTSFPEQGNAAFAQEIKLTSQQVVAHMQLEAGEYAVSAFIDMNANGKLDENFFGVPQEPYLLSQNFVPTLSSPDFGDCSFTLDGNQRIKLNMID